MSYVNLRRSHACQLSKNQWFLELTTKQILRWSGTSEFYSLTISLQETGLALQSKPTSLESKWSVMLTHLAFQKMMQVVWRARWILLCFIKRALPIVKDEEPGEIYNSSCQCPQLILILLGSEEKQLGKITSSSNIRHRTTSRMHLSQVLTSLRSLVNTSWEPNHQCLILLI